MTLALFRQVPWRAVPVMPIEIMLLPKWFPFHLMKVSYWSRTVLVPLLVLMAMKPRAKTPRRVGIEELFHVQPDEGQDKWRNPTRSHRGVLFLDLEQKQRVDAPRLP